MATETIENVDQGEVAKFNEMASRWWDPDGDFRPLHQRDAISLNFATSPWSTCSIVSVAILTRILESG